MSCFGKYRVADHRGGLDQMLETEGPITKEAFDRLIGSGLYKFYVYDDRIKADRYILVDMDHNFGLPTWINVYRD